MIKPKGLGRGLSSLMGENLIELNNEGVDGLNHILITNISGNPDQPRVIFNDNELEELARSIKKNGVLQPILLKKMEKGQYQIIAGERRWRAAKIAGLNSIPALIKDMDKREILEVALIENIQRENLTPLEEAEGYKKLIDGYMYTQEQMAAIVSKSRSHVSNLLRLLGLSGKIKQCLNDGSISLGHAKLLVNQKAAENIVDLIIANGLNVRETEILIRESIEKPKYSRAIKNSSNSSSKNGDIIALESSLSLTLGMGVTIEHSTKGGKVSVHFQNIDQFDNIIQKLSKSIN